MYLRLPGVAKEWILIMHEEGRLIQIMDRGKQREGKEEEEEEKEEE